MSRALVSMAGGLVGLAAAARGELCVVDNRRPTAADTNPGTRNAPLATIAAAAARAVAGDTVLVRPGVYREAITLNNSDEQGLPIVFRSEVPRAAVISGADVVTDLNVEAPGVLSFPVAYAWRCQYSGGNPQWVYLDGLPLERAETPDRVVPGTFYHSLDARRMLVSPGGRGLDGRAYSWISSLVSWSGGR